MPANVINASSNTFLEKVREITFANELNVKLEKVIPQSEEESVNL